MTPLAAIAAEEQGWTGQRSDLAAWVVGIETLALVVSAGIWAVPSILLGRPVMDWAMAVSAATGSASVPADDTFVGGLIYSAVICQVVATLLWFYILNKLPAGAAGMGTLATPVIGVICASVELGERPSFLEGSGMLLILAALAILSFYGIRQHNRNQTAVERK